MSVSTMEVAAHGPGTLSRTHTAPISLSAMNPSYPGGVGHQNRPSQLSGITAINSIASSQSLSSMSSSHTLTPTSSGGQVVATNNIINQRADASRSLYQICVNLRERLNYVPGFDEHWIDMEDEEDEGDDSDPVSSLWRCLRKGHPLMTIYNTLQPAVLLEIDEKVSEKNRPKTAASKFVLACLKDLKLPAASTFQLQDLFGDDTTGFVKVTQVINVVLDVAEERGLLLTPKRESQEVPGVSGKTKMSYRDHVVKELVDTERKYVQDLENLHELKKVIEQKGVINGDVVHDIFLNINAILDFQRRFLIKIETTNSQSDDRQQWGLPFVNYEQAFDIYQPFIANQRKAATIAMRDFDKIALADHPVCVDYNTLDGFLLKPMQRLVKYPLLLKDLRDKTNADEETKVDLTRGMEAANRVLRNANAAVDRELRDEALTDLCNRVDDWKNHDIDHFGELLLHGQFTVLTGKSDIEKEFSIYLFERILLCCKEFNPNKPPKEKLLGQKKEKKDKLKGIKDKNAKPGKLQLKGRIFMTNVSDVISLVKPGSYTVQIWWKGDPGVENFIIRFSNEETMKKWSTSVSKQRKECNDRAAESGSATDSEPANFAWMKDQSLQNPYANLEQEDDEEYSNSPAAYTSHGAFGMYDNALPRNASSTSLRSRSTTGESQQSLASIARAPAPRLPLAFQNQQLSLQTQGFPPQLPSPGPKGGDSYFSPVAESPASSRTSQNGTPMYPFPRQPTPQGYGDEYNRYTAPAMARGASRDSQNNNQNGFQNGRPPQRPSLPAMASQSASSQQRSRSYSTPDINGPGGTGRRLPNGQLSTGPVPTVPSIPAHLAYDTGIPRSNNSSPNNTMPIRSNTQSPGVQRERLLQQPAFPIHPTYLRSQTTQPLSNLDQRTISPPPSSAGFLPSVPTQLKVKVNCDGNYVTLVVAFNITYQTLVDRIDAKIGRFSNNAIARGTMRLRYRDEDGDFVTMESDEDIQIAFQEWQQEMEASGQEAALGGLGEIELFCASVDAA